eukprot:gnl/TRDRNA2_/TRDRNA2_176547_c0_seq1.p1 gnl/TRDRNA2_/TRDRNA2_176547_c0~~gnl/TRDRNA2_/TRDRNA2_176547_c0_seq1.p1  ORF type:complete len:491 (+),score=64.75 gnl/TRDRNA2_/TRDRNA2_176547_c0_seq1:59-1531(+)
MATSSVFVCIVLLTAASAVDARRVVRSSPHGHVASAAVPTPIFTRLSRFDDAEHRVPALRPSTGGVGSGGQAAVPGTKVSVRQASALRMGWAARVRGGRRGSAAKKQNLHFHQWSGAKDGPPRGVLQLKDLYGTEYTGMLGVGTMHGVNGQPKPESELRVIYDTGSANLWVASDLCTEYPCAMPPRHHFNHSRSETFRPTQHEISDTFGSGALSGVFGTDDVQVGPLVAREQGVLLIQEEIGEAFARIPFDGLVGLGFPALATNLSTPFFDTLMRQGALQRQEFAFYFHKDLKRGGALLWGGTDPRLYEEPMLWFPVAEEKYWALDFAGFSLGTYALNAHDAPQAAPSQETLRLIVDSGTTFFGFPTEVFDAFADDVGPAACTAIDRFPNMVFTLRTVEGTDHEVIVPPSEYMVRTGMMHNGEELCMPGVVELPAPIIIVGEVFMRHYFTVFRRGGNGERSSVGIARIRYGDDADAFFRGEPVQKTAAQI